MNCSKLFYPPPRAMKINETQINGTQLSLKFLYREKNKPHKNTKTTCRMGEVFANEVTDKGLLSKI